MERYIRAVLKITGLRDRVIKCLFVFIQKVSGLLKMVKL
jgi:hypothetical protein